MLERIIDFLRPYLDAPWGYVIVGVAVFLENSVGAGLIVPGETLVILGGFYARVGDLWLPLVTLIVVVCAIAGDNVGFLIGKRYGRRFLERHGKKLLITPARLEMTERYYEEHGGKTIFLGRFVPVVRSAGFIVAGAAQMEWRRFIVYDVIGATLWGVGHTLLGYFLGASYERWEKYLTPVGIGLAVILLVLVGGSKMLAARRRVREELDEIEQELEREQELELEREPGIGRSEGHEVADGRVGPPAVHGGDGGERSPPEVG